MTKEKYMKDNIHLLSLFSSEQKDFGYAYLEALYDNMFGEGEFDY